MNKRYIVILALLSLLVAACTPYSDSVYAHIWVDTNRDGIRDVGEPRLEGVVVNIYNGAGELLESTTSDSVGRYYFPLEILDDVEEISGGITLEFLPPDGYWFTSYRQGTDDEDNSAADPEDGTIGPIEDKDDVTNEGTYLTNFNVGVVEYASTASIAGFVWHDQNQNGLQDEDEPGLEAVQITLFGEDGQQVGQISTDIEGLYEFTGLTPGDYSMLFNPPGDYLLTMQDEGEDDTLDSDPHSPSGLTERFRLGDGEHSDIDAGFYVPAGGAASFCYGPGGGGFPEGVSPLSGLPVSEPAYLGLNPVFTSISIFPPSVRPPSGLASAPQVFQLYIGDGDSRLLVVNYGEFPVAAFGGDDTAGSESAAPEPAGDNDYVISGRVWFDYTPDHLEGESEPGINNVEVRLLDSNFQEVATTTTNAFGLYWFELEDVEPNTEFQVRVGAPPTLSSYYFVNKDVGDDDTIDSDVTANGRTDFFDPTDEPDNSFANLDAGIREVVIIPGFRSGRTAHQDIQGNYCGCLVAAGADPEVADQINVCANAFSSDPDDIGAAGLDVTRLLAIAENYTENSSCRPNLREANLFCTDQPRFGSPGNELYMQYNINNISHFEYDDALGAYTWALSTPKSEAERGSAPFSVETEDYTQMVDGLTDETLTFENVVVLMVEHTAQNAAVTIIDLKMYFETGTAYVFRNGQVFEATWSTLTPDSVADRDQPVPVHLEMGGDPFPLAPGQTFFNIVNTFDTMTEISTGVWLADFDAPAYIPD